MKPQSKICNLGGPQWRKRARMWNCARGASSVWAKRCAVQRSFGQQLFNLRVQRGKVRLAHVTLDDAALLVQQEGGGR